MSLVLGGCCREIISSNGFHQQQPGVGGGKRDVVNVNVNSNNNNNNNNNKRSLMMISSSIEKQNQNHLSCFSVDPSYLSSSSSIGDDSDLDDDDDLDDEFTSSNVKFSMDSLEESLPIKRGLSNYFSGRSKAFANLSEAKTVKSLAKTENPFNKRRRTLMACRRRSNNNTTSSSRRRRETSSLIISPVSMPILKLNEDDDDDETETESDEDDDETEQLIKMKKINTNKDDDDEEVESTAADGNHEHGRIKRFKSPRCFSLTDLNHHYHSPPITKNV